MVAVPAGPGRFQAMRKQPGTGGGPPRSTERRRYSLGEHPTSSVNRELNDPRLVKPTRWQISVTVRLAARSRSLARSTRRRLRYAPGVSPNAAANPRAKWYRENPAARAIASRSSGSA